MRKFIKTLSLNISLITACFGAAEYSIDLDQISTYATFPPPPRNLALLTGSIIDNHSEYVASSAAAVFAGGGRIKGVIELLMDSLDPDLQRALIRYQSCRHKDYSCKCPLAVKLQSFPTFFQNKTRESVAVVLSAAVAQRCLPEETLILSQIIDDYVGELSLAQSIQNPKEMLSNAIDQYWKYVSQTVKQHFCIRPFIILAEDEVDDIAKALGTTALVNLEVMRTQHKHLLHSEMASRLLTGYINDIAKEYGLRQKLEHNHDWGIVGNFFQFIIYIEETPLSMLFNEAPLSMSFLVFGVDSYRQEREAYYKSYPILMQVRLNPNGLPLDVAKQFRRYFRQIARAAHQQLLSDQ